MRGAGVVVAAALLAGCSTLSPLGCPAGTRPVTEAQLFFGRNVGGVVGVSEDDWRTFVDAEIASRFPDGFTVEDAVGQWKGADGAVVREPSKRLTVVLAGGAGNAEKLKAIRTAYKGRFHQDAVLLVRTDACAGF